MRVLVTGASGFIGLPIVQCLEHGGHEVLAMSRNPPNSPAKSSVNWLKSDLSLPYSYLQEIQIFAPEVLIHLSWQGIPDFSLDISRNNLNHSLDLLSFVIGLGTCQKILVSGSCFELNKLNGECFETETGSPKDNFTWAKHALRSWLESTCRAEQVCLGWMRLFYVYGPRQRINSLIPSVLAKLSQGKLPEIRTPQNANDFIFVEDIAEAFLNAVSLDILSGTYHLGSGQSTSIIEVCRTAEKIIYGTDTLTKELEFKTRKIPRDINFWANSSQAKSILQWRPEIKIEEGIQRTWKWENSR